MGLIASTLLLVSCSSGTGDGATTAAPAPSSAATASASPGPEYEFTDPNGFRYSIALYALGTMNESTNLDTDRVAPPGSSFPVFSAQVRNLQQDRPAPLPSFDGLPPASPLSFSLPEEALPADQKKHWTCNEAGMNGCRKFVSLHCSYQNDGSRTPTVVSPFDETTISPGESTTMRCHTGDPVPAAEGQQVRLYFDAGKRTVPVQPAWVEIPRPS